MRIVADKDILALDSEFSALGDLCKKPGREITQADLLDADALLVRSITRVDESLLQGTSVRFVGSATSGTDHVDLDYLQAQGICFVDAKGCNARAVVEYCFAALAHLSATEKSNFFDKSFAIIGAGHVGGLFAESLTQLGISCLICDPELPLVRQQELESLGCLFVPLSQALQAEVVTLHTSLTRNGAHPTYHMLGQKQLKLLAPDAVLINTSRGEVLDNDALLRTLESRSDLRVILDVWENEPFINTALLGRVSIASPHIAGYSIQAKRGATERLSQGLSEFLGLKCDTQTEQLANSDSMVDLNTHKIHAGDSFCWDVLSRSINIEMISEQFKRSFSEEPASAAELFDSIRQSLVSRQEFASYRIGSEALSEQQLLLLRVLCFNFRSNQR